MSDGPVLHVLSGDLAGRAYRVEDREFVIGRSPSCDLVIPKRYISREHARIVGGRKGFVVASLSEKNPVQLRDRPVRSKAELEDGDEFEMCGIRFRFRLKGQVRARKVEGVRMEGSGDGGWEDAPADDDGWEDAPADDDGWEDEVKGGGDADDDWIDDEPSEPEGKKPLKAKGSVVFGEEEDEGEDTEEVNEKTAELNPTVDPDDPDYDPFAEVDNQVKAEKKTVDPAREKLLRVLLVVAVLGIAFAGFVVNKVLEPPPLRVVQYNDGEEVLVRVDEVVVIEVPFSDSNPPEGYASRNVDFRGNYQRFHEDDTVQVEWLNYLNRVVLLVRGLEEGPSQFQIFFPVSNVRQVFTISVEGDPPLQVEREERQAEFKKLKPNKLRSMLSEAVTRGDGYLEGYGTGKEHFLWLALREYETAIDAGDAMRDLTAGMGQALNQKDRENLAKANRKVEETREEYDKKRDQLHQRYIQTFVQNVPGANKLKALRTLMRGIGNEGDMMFIRLKYVLEDGTKGFGEKWKGF